MKTKWNFLLILALLAFSAVGIGSAQAADVLSVQQADIGVPPGLIHLYTANDNANDLVGTAHGSFPTTVTFENNFDGQAFSFPGSNDSLVTLPVNIGPSSLPNMTMGMWVKLRSQVNDRGWVIGHDNGGYDRALILHDDRFYGFAAGVGHLYTSTLGALTQNEWQCVAVSYSDSNTATVFLNGKNQTVSTTNGDGLSVATIGGVSYHALPHGVNGLVDNVFIFNRALSVSEIQQTCEFYGPPKPTITPTIQGTLGLDGWYTSDVDLTWTVSDNMATITSQTGCDPVTIAQDQAETTYTCSATNAGGTNTVAVSIKRDATPPTLNPVVTPNPVLLNGNAIANPYAEDVLSGIAYSNCDPVITSSINSHTVNCTATDNAGNHATDSAAYGVVYDFVGFTSPIDNLPVLNLAKAGQTIPLKWRILDANGVPVTNLTSVTVSAVSLSCSANTTLDLIEEYAAGGSGLQNLGNGYYQWNWKTPTTYVNSCKTLKLDLGDGLVHTALFQFKK
jgi:hypothetical protein